MLFLILRKYQVQVKVFIRCFIYCFVLSSFVMATTNLSFTKDEKDAFTHLLERGVKFFDQSKKDNVTVVYDDLALKLCDNDQNYSIHGWWPEHNNHSWPQWCTNQFKTFTEANIDSIKNELENNWYACKEWNMTNFDIWYHEINKHGSCIQGETILHYFEHALMIFNEAKQNSWFGCCKNSNEKQCLIPFTKNINGTKWLGYCHDNPNLSFTKGDSIHQPKYF
jgi:hypothetical protein